MSISVVRTLPEDEWRHFVDKHPDGNIFHTPEMFQVFSRTKHFRPELWAAIKDQRLLALLLPVRITLIDGLMRYFTTRSVVYGSILYMQNTEGHEALKKLLQTYTYDVGGPPLFTELRNLSDLDAIQPTLNEHGFVYEEHLNYLIDLNHSPEAVFKKIGRRTRKHIRRGLRRADIFIEELKERGQITACYNLLRKTYRNARVPLADRSLFEAAFDVLHPKNMVLFTQACLGEIPVANSVDLLYKDIIYGWYGGMDRSYSRYMPNELIMWNILKYGAENGYRLYDFGGAGKPEEKYGVRDFKAKFGGELVCFGRNTYTHAPILFSISKFGYRINQKLNGFIK